jgi:hypothetical protein
MRPIGGGRFVKTWQYPNEKGNSYALPPIVRTQQVRHLNAYYDLLAYKPSAQHLNAYYDLLTYRKKVQHLSAYYDLQAYKPSVQHLNASYDLLTYQEKVQHLNAYYDLLATIRYYGWALNLTTGAISKFDNYNFNSLTTTLGAGSDGIFDLTGATDNGAAIDAFVETGKLDFDTTELKRCTYYYVAKNGGKLRLSVDTENTKLITYPVIRATTEPETERVKLAMGAKGKYWQLKLANVDGSAAVVDAQEILVEKLTRKIQ